MEDIEANAILLSLEEKISEIFTKNRLRIVEVIRDKNPKSIGELSKLLKRDISAVYRDLKILEKYEILRLERRGRTVKPILSKSMLLIPIIELEDFKEVEEDQCSYIG